MSTRGSRWSWMYWSSETSGTVTVVPLKSCAGRRDYEPLATPRETKNSTVPVAPPSATALRVTFDS